MVAYPLKDPEYWVFALGVSEFDFEPGFVFVSIKIDEMGVPRWGSRQV
jgi:hypothetical protein